MSQSKQDLIRLFKLDFLHDPNVCTFSTNFYAFLFGVETGLRHTSSAMIHGWCFNSEQQQQRTDSGAMTTPTHDQAATLAEVAMDAHNGAMLTITPHDHDVLCGRGGLTNHHKGNAWYRRLVSCNRPLYRGSPKHTKLLVSKAIVQAVHSQSPPGRFLERHKTTGLWHPVAYKRAVDKTSQALREKERFPDENQPETVTSIPASDKESSLHELARAAVERAGGMPNYSAGTTAPAKPAAKPAPAPEPTMRRPTVNDQIKSQMSTYAIQALQSAGGIPKTWGGYPYPSAGLPPAMAAMSSLGSIPGSAMGTFPAFAMGNMPGAYGSIPGLAMGSIPGSARSNQMSGFASRALAAPAPLPQPVDPPAPAPSPPATKPAAGTAKRPREATNGRLSRNHRKLPTKKRRITSQQEEEEVVPPPPLQDRASSMFRFFEENKLLPSSRDSSAAPAAEKQASSTSECLSSTSEDDTPLTMLMQVATSELVDKEPIKDKGAVSKSDPLQYQNSGSSDASGPSLTRMTSQISDWLKTPFWPHPQVESSSVAAPPAAMPPPQLEPAVSSTLLKLYPSRLFAALFDRNQSMSQMPQPQQQQPQQHGKSTGGSLLDDYEESALETKLRTVPTTSK